MKTDIPEKVFEEFFESNSLHGRSIIKTISEFKKLIQAKVCYSITNGTYGFYPPAAIKEMSITVPFLWKAFDKQIKTLYQFPINNKISFVECNDSFFDLSFSANGVFFLENTILLIFPVYREEYGYTHADPNIFLFGDSGENVHKFMKKYKEMIDTFGVQNILKAGNVISFDGREFAPSDNFKGASDWDNLILEKTIKTDLIQEIRWFLSKEGEDWYKENRFVYKRGYLLAGSPGGGKSTFISKLVSEFNNYQFVILERVSEMSIDAYEIREYFSFCKKLKRCFCILEDIDLLCTEGSMQSLLNCLSGLNEVSGLITIATTNHPERIDPALANRPSRFDRIIEFNEPNREIRLEYIQKIFIGINPDFYDSIAKETDGLSFAFLKELYTSICIREKYSNTKMTMKEIKQTINRLQIHKKDTVKGDEPHSSLGFGKVRCSDEE